MTPEHPDSTVDGTLRIVDNSRHERSGAPEGGQIVSPGAFDIASLPDHMDVWMQRYLAFVVAGVRSSEVAAKIELHLSRFRQFFQEAYGHDRLSICLQRDVATWQRHLVDQGLAPATVNNHLASLSSFTSWVSRVAPALVPLKDPAKGVSELGLPPS